jgi:hypothetical protein
MQPAGEKAAAVIPLRWPSKVFKHSPESLLQSLAVRSLEPVSTIAASGEKTAAKIRPRWPSKVFKHSPESLLQSFAV